MSERDRVDALALVLLEAWKNAEPDSSVTKYPTSYLPTFADMARAALAAVEAQPVAAAQVFDWPDAAVLSVMNAVGDGPYGEEDMAVTRRFLRRAEEVRAELVAAPQPLTDERVDNIAELVVKGMPDGLRGFTVTWGWRQFARALLADCAGYAWVPPQPLTDEQIAAIVREASAGSAMRRDGSTAQRIARAIERAHGIGDQP